MAEEAAPDSPTLDAGAKVAAEATAVAEDIESRITTALRSRVGHFKEQADSLTFEGVRRLLEKDLGLEAFALDVHKRFVKQCLLKCLDGGNDGEGPENSGETVEKNACTTSEGTESPKVRKANKGGKETCSEDEEKSEDSPVLGLLTGHKTMKTENFKTEKKENKEVPESIIKKAIRKRVSYVEANSDKVTMAGLRRLLEEDLKLDKYTLDPYKNFISEQLDELLKSREVSSPASSGSKSDEEEEDEDEQEEEEEEEEVKSQNKITPKGKIKNSQVLKKRKIPKKEAEMPSKKRKHTKSVSDDNSDEEDSGAVSDGSSRSPTVKRKEISAPIYGKRVENLKSIIKSCGMSVPPSVYKRVKEVPENKREAQLVKELEEILHKEGLSANSSEKEINVVRRRKERAKELEGIDMSNIVSSTRRRSTTSFVVPPNPKIPDISDDDEHEESDGDDDDDDDDNEDNDDEDTADDGNSQSELEEEDDDDSD